MRGLCALILWRRIGAVRLYRSQGHRRVRLTWIAMELPSPEMEQGDGDVDDVCVPPDAPMGRMSLHGCAVGCVIGSHREECVVFWP